jgi:hypothetical protein
VEEVFLVDDDPGWVRPDQLGCWVAIEPFDGGEDNELARTRSALEHRLTH